MKHSEIHSQAPALKWRRACILTKLWLRRKAKIRFAMIEARRRSMRMCQSMQQHGYIN